MGLFRGQPAFIGFRRDCPDLIYFAPLADIERACPGVGREWIRSLLTDMKAAGEVTCRGKGPAARWQYSGSKGINS